MDHDCSSQHRGNAKLRCPIFFLTQHFLGSFKKKKHKVCDIIHMAI